VLVDQGANDQFLHLLMALPSAGYAVFLRAMEEHVRFGGRLEKLSDPAFRMQGGFYRR
jgi:hypothetical protein